MKFSVSQIKRNSHNEPYQFEEQVDVSGIESLNNDIRQIDPVHIKGTASVHGEEIVFSFVIDGTMVLPCARTLVDVPYPFKVNAVEVFSESIYDDDEDSSGNEIHPIDGELLDFTPYIKENILLEVPYRVFSTDEKTTSQTPLEGEGWELVTEGNNEKKIDPRLKKLESFLDDKKDKEE